jgi:drug/metabolite transporter (DMT)-like permease
MQARYVLLLLATAVLWSLGGVLIKLIDLAPVTIAGSRCLIAGIIIAIAKPDAMRKTSWQTLPGAIAYALTVILFVIATKLTTAANAIFLQYTAPVYIALISPWYLREQTNCHDWILVGIALGGIALFFCDRLSLQGLTGIIVALGSGVSFAWMTVLMRRERTGSPEAVVLIGNTLAVLIALPWMFPIPALATNGPRLLVLGVVQLALPYLLYSVAIRHVRALDAAVISIIEPILNPIWVMIVTSERPTIWTILGGTIVLGTSLAKSLISSTSIAHPASAQKHDLERQNASRGTDDPKFRS